MDEPSTRLRLVEKKSGTFICAMDLLGLIPRDLKIEIFKILGPKELSAAECVSKDLQQFVSQGFFWEVLVKNY